LTLPRTIGLTFELGGPDVVTFNQLLEAILLRRRRRRWIVHVPLPLARITAWCLEGMFPLLLRRAPPLNRDQILMLGEDNVGDSSAAWREFNHQPVALSDGLNALLGTGVTGSGG
jgi:NADH dehydrogenase